MLQNRVRAFRSFLGLKLGVNPRKNAIFASSEFEFGHFLKQAATTFLQKRPVFERPREKGRPSRFWFNKKPQNFLMDSNREKAHCCWKLIVGRLFLMDSNREKLIFGPSDPGIYSLGKNPNLIIIFLGIPPLHEEVHHEKECACYGANERGNVRLLRPLIKSLEGILIVFISGDHKIPFGTLHE